MTGAATAELVAIEDRRTEASDRRDYLEYLTRLADLANQGLSQREIARELGKGRTTIRRDLKLLQGAGYVPIDRMPADEDRYADGPRPLVGLRAITPKAPLARVTGGRITQTNPGIKVGVLMPPPGEWRVEDLEASDLMDMAASELVSRLVRMSPEVSRARHDFLRMANPGWTATATNPDTDEPDDNAQLAVDAFLDTLRTRHGTPDKIWNRLLDGQFTRGALFCELILDASGRIPLDIATPDPFTALFRTAEDPDLGVRWELVQKQGRELVNIERPTVKHVPVDPTPDTPYGTAPVGPAMFPALYLLHMLTDSRRVVAQQGWPRLDIEIVVEAALSLMEASEASDPAKKREWIDTAISEIAQAYSSLDPDKAFVHTDTVKMNTPIGAIGSLDGIGELVTILERQSARALKTMPLLFGMDEGVSEANAIRQWEIHSSTIQSFQKDAEAVISDLLTFACEAQGIATKVVFTFNILRSSEEFRDAETMEKKLANAEKMELLGYETHDAASMYAVGHEPAEEAMIGAVGDEEDQPEEPAAPDEEDETPAAEEEDTPDGDGDRMTTFDVALSKEEQAVGATALPDEDTGGGANQIQQPRLVNIDQVLHELGITERDFTDAVTLLMLSARKTPKAEPEGEPLPVPATVQVDEVDLRAATRTWDNRMPDEAGILVAEEQEEDEDGDDQ